jgi:glucokinase
LGEYYYGKGKGYDSMIGLTVGTGVGAGIIINKKLYAGHSIAAGEFGMLITSIRFMNTIAAGLFLKMYMD